MNQQTLEGHRDGKTYEAEFDYDRLNRQQKAVYDVMKDGHWRTLRAISLLTQPSDSAFRDTAGSCKGPLYEHAVSMANKINKHIILILIIAHKYFDSRIEENDPLIVVVFVDIYLPVNFEDSSKCRFSTFSSNNC